MQQQLTLLPTGFGVNDVQIMAGTFDDFSFDEVVQVLGLSRQCLRLLIRQGEGAISEILLKAGQVLEARMPLSSDPENVFKALFGSAVRGSGLSFSVYHTEPTGPFPMPKCRLNDVYGRARTAGQNAVASAHGAQHAQTFAPSEPTLRLQEHRAPSFPTQVMPGTGPARASAHGAQHAQTFAPSEPTLRLQEHRAPSFPTQVMPGTGPARSGFSQAPALTAPQVTGCVVTAEGLPTLSKEIAGVLGQVQAQAKSLQTLDGRLQVLPQLIASELRAALAQHERHMAAAAPRPEPRVDSSHKTLMTVLAVGVGALLLVVVALAMKIFR